MTLPINGSTCCRSVARRPASDQEVAPRRDCDRVGRLLCKLVYAVRLPRSELDETSTGSSTGRCEIARHGRSFDGSANSRTCCSRDTARCGGIGRHVVDRTTEGTLSWHLRLRHTSPRGHTVVTDCWARSVTGRERADAGCSLTTRHSVTGRHAPAGSDTAPRGLDSRHLHPLLRHVCAGQQVYR